jgi:hypothetical protein
VKTQHHLVMLKVSRKLLSAKLSKRAERTLYTLSRDAVPTLGGGKASGCVMSWSLTNKALSGSAHTAVKHVFWDHMSKGQYQPVIVVPYPEQFSATVTHAELAKLFVEYLKSFKTLDPGKKSSKPMTLTFETGKLTIAFDGQDDRIVPITATIAQPISVMLRTKDVYGIVCKLKQFEAPVVTLSGNISGVIKAAFTDGIGEYAVYIPTFACSVRRPTGATMMRRAIAIRHTTISRCSVTRSAWPTPCSTSK